MLQVMYYLLTGDENADPVKLRAFRHKNGNQCPLKQLTNAVTRPLQISCTDQQCLRQQN
jgi:hypothetical protein